MLSHTLPLGRSGLGADTERATIRDPRIARPSALRAEVTSTESTQPTALNQLLVVLSPQESHHHVAVRAQLLVNDVTVQRAVVLTEPSSALRRLLSRMPLPGALRVARPDIETSSRLLRASGVADRMSFEVRERPDAVLSLASESDLVLVGRRRTRPWLLPPLGREARRLLRRSQTPVLVVGRKPRGPYRHVVVATDLETDLTVALDWTRRVAPLAAVTLLHVYRPLFESRLAWAGATDGRISEFRLAAQREAAWGMATLLKRYKSKATHPALLSYGSATNDVVCRSCELGADLIVVARNNHSWWMEALGASVSVETAARAEDCDVLVVHEDSGGTSCTSIGRAS